MSEWPNGDWTPAPRWLILPGDPPALKHLLLAQAAQHEDGAPLPPEPAEEA